MTVVAEAGRKIVTLTDEGRAHVAENRDRWPDPFGDAAESRTGPTLRGLLTQVNEAARQVARTGTPEQVDGAATILSDARRALYLLLADGPEGKQD